MLGADDSEILLDQMPVGRNLFLLEDMVAPRRGGDPTRQSVGYRRPSRLGRPLRCLNDWYFYANGKDFA